MKKKKLIQSVMMAILIVFASVAQASSSDGDAVAKRGTVACNAAWNESVDSKSRWAIRNLNDDASITLDRMRVYTATGALDYDSNTDGPAPSGTGVSFGVIAPHQTVQFKSEDLIGAGLLTGTLPSSERPGTAIFDWSSTEGKRVLTPFIQMTRPGSGARRHGSECRTIDLGPGHDDGESDSD